MAKKIITIDSILDGFSQTQYLSSKGSIDSSIGVDPDLPLTTTFTKASGMPVPSQYADFHGAGLSGAPMWVLTMNKGSTVYAYAADGEFIEYSSALTAASELVIGTPTSGAGNGAAYYNNYIYLATPTNISRYGPLDGGATLTNTVWTGATLGSQTAMTNTTYPSLRGVALPNHPMHVHGDNALYVGDVLNGQGILHKIKTKKVTDEGDTNDGSSYDALDLPFGFIPIDIEAWGVDIVVLAVQTTNTTINQGKAALFFWETTDTDTFYRGPVYLPDPLGTALLNVNGILRIFSGNASSGVRVSKYIGGETISDRDIDTEFLEDSLPPFAGAVDAFGSRGVWGGFSTYPENSACVWSLGSKKGKVLMGLHNIVRATSTNPTNQIVTALKFVEQQDAITPKMVVGWKDNTTQGLDKYGTTGTINSVWRTRFQNVGQKFQIIEIRVPLGKAVGANMEIIPVVGLDDQSSTLALTTINNTNYTNSPRKVMYKEPDLPDVIGENNFWLEYNHGGTVTLPQLLPIKVTIETFDEE